VPSANTRSALLERVAGADSVHDVFRVASERLRRLIDHDAAVWIATDPGTGLPTSPSRSEHLRHLCGDGRSCLRVWELEFLHPDVNLYRDLARSPLPAGALRMATGDRPARSSRYRAMLKPSGYGDELRAVLRADGRPWATVGLCRERGRPAFDAGDAELVAGLSEPLGTAVRDHARPAVAPSAAGGGHGPGLLVFGADGELASINDAARAWLEELPIEPGEELGPFGVRLPMVVAGTLMRARALARGQEEGHARARLRTRVTGRWLVFHASTLRGADGTPGDTALIVEPAAGSEIAPIVAEAYQLSPREQQITELIALGLATAEMAERLFLSVHTIRDYVKAIFEKTGVSSRGELVAKLFAEHYAPMHLAPGANARIG
jgi:DNA-binding CsgD family transcriptional regulator